MLTALEKLDSQKNWKKHSREKQAKCSRKTSVLQILRELTGEKVPVMLEEKFHVSQQKLKQKYGTRRSSSIAYEN
jgi:hypothetical protein